MQTSVVIHVMVQCYSNLHRCKNLVKESCVKTNKSVKNPLGMIILKWIWRGGGIGCELD
jgi:hypothetical protein